jgi:hypothetical protein
MNIFQPEDQDDFASTLSRTIGSVLERIANESTAVVTWASVTGVQRFNQGTGLVVDFTVVADQIYYYNLTHAIEWAISNSTSGFLADLQTERTSYTYVPSLALGGNVTLSTGNSCHACHSACGTCIGPDNGDCLTCAANFVRHGRTCITTCPAGTYYDAFDNLCKDLECERGDAVLVADTGATVRLNNSWQYAHEFLPWPISRLSIQIIEKV